MTKNWSRSCEKSLALFLPARRKDVLKDLVIQSHSYTSHFHCRCRCTDGSGGGGGEFGGGDEGGGGGGTAAAAAGGGFRGG